MEEAIFQLSCGHLFHAPCLEQWFKTRARCPKCQRNFGSVVGGGPRCGCMQWYMERFQLPGHPSADETIVVEFGFPAGTDDNGQRFGGRRVTAYLPGCTQGTLLLELFKVALRRRIMFGIGHSMTTGEYRPTYNIHLKTSRQHGVAGHGYPDDTYMERSFAELRSNGVGLADLPL